MEKIILYGTGKKAEHLLELLDKLKQFEIIEVWDNDERKCGEQFSSFTITKPQKQDEFAVLVASTYYSQIKENLVKEYQIAEKIIKPWNYCFHYIKEQIIGRYQESEDAEIQSVIRFLETEELDVMNRAFRKKYETIYVPIERDEEKKLFYTYWHGKKMYLASKFSTKRAAENYVRRLMEEQDKDSPHFYGNSAYGNDKKGVVVDAGAAEGFWALDALEYASQAVLLEGEPEWLEALHYTFEPYQDKVKIIPEFLVESGEKRGITLSQLCRETGAIACMKMDVEGAEFKILQSESELLGTNVIERLLVCTYHQSGDAGDIKGTLEDAGYQTEFSQGYMFFPYGREIEAELRKGLIRAEK